MVSFTYRSVAVLPYRCSQGCILKQEFHGVLPGAAAVFHQQSRLAMNDAFFIDVAGGKNARGSQPRHN